MRGAHQEAAGGEIAQAMATEPKDKLTGDRAIKVAFEELCHPEPSRRYEAAILLGNPEKWLDATRTPEIMRRLLPLLDDANWHVRYYVAVALGELGYADAIEVLVRHVNDPDARVSNAIQKAIAVLRAGI
jgi:HEAT repeat protein